MIASLALVVIRWGVPERLGRATAWLMAILTTAMLLIAAKAIYDRSIITKHEAKAVAADIASARKADDAAGAQRSIDTARAAQEKTALDKVTEHASQAPISDARVAYYRCVRLQQTARKHGQPAPVCD